MFLAYLVRLLSIGHKHKVRAVRRGVKPNQALLSPSSSTPSASSEHSFTANNPNNGKGGAKSGNKFVAPTPASGATETTSRQRRTSSGATLVRHQSSGCLSRHFQSTLSLSRTRSGSSALNKARSRSMNLLLVQADAGSTSSSSDDGYVDVDVDERQGSVSLKRRAYNLVNGRPRSLSVRTTSITKEDESRSRKGIYGDFTIVKILKLIRGKNFPLFYFSESSVKFIFLFWAI